MVWKLSRPIGRKNKAKPFIFIQFGSIRLGLDTIYSKSGDLKYKILHIHSVWPNQSSLNVLDMMAIHIEGVFCFPLELFWLGHKSYNEKEMKSFPLCWYSFFNQALVVWKILERIDFFQTLFGSFRLAFKSIKTWFESIRYYICRQFTFWFHYW